MYTCAGLGCSRLVVSWQLLIAFGRIMRNLRRRSDWHRYAGKSFLGPHECNQSQVVDS
jgi:hypothetical protein